MSQNLEYILPPGEVELYVKTLEPTSIEELGTMRWFEKHDRLQKLHQQTIFETGSLREESVKEAFVSLAKIPVLVQEAVCVSVWREKVFPALLEVNPLPKNTFMPYMVLYHEVTAVAQLETVLFHQDSCEALDDSCIDLIDYCAVSIISLASLTDYSLDTTTVTSRSTIEELQYQQKELAFDIAIRSITILSYIAQALDRLPLPATTRIYNTHDVPMMFKNLLDSMPWIRHDAKGHTLKYLEGKWKLLEGEAKMKLSRTEAQIWLCLRHLLLDPKCLTYYEFNDYRKTQLTKLQGRLHDIVMDQVSPLVELKQWLSTLSISTMPSSAKPPIIIEMVPQIRQNILRQNKGKWTKIIKQQMDTFFNKEDQMIEVANRLKATFDLDTLEALAPDARSCVVCGDPAPKRCSRCKTYWFCGRECQVKNWTTHKPICDKIVNAEAI
ncbi:hypothetical protein R5R35_001477 [Gryllus longicercus]|uniref:MYND-type domain-containing protein n=1 Tax=Gryllus longicercus TaxID=2509291 RepID=A0AAN9VK14_9ORTH